jgi:hypothetical protein
MGFKRIELYPTTISTITPASKDVRVKAFAVLGSVAATATYAWLPANATVVDVGVAVQTAANATNTAISVGLGSTTNALVSAQSITVIGHFRGAAAGGYGLEEGNQPGSDQKVTAELTGAASTNGVAVVMIHYVM